MNQEVFEKIYELLKELNVKVVWYYPETFKNLPIISYYIANDADQSFTTGSNLVLTEQACIIDVWARTPEETISLASQTDSKLKQIGLKKVFANSLDPLGDAKRISMRYEWVFNIQTKQITRQ